MRFTAAIVVSYVMFILTCAAVIFVARFDVWLCVFSYALILFNWENILEGIRDILQRIADEH